MSPMTSESAGKLSLVAGITPKAREVFTGQAAGVVPAEIKQVYDRARKMEQSGRSSDPEAWMQELTEEIHDTLDLSGRARRMVNQFVASRYARTPQEEKQLAGMIGEPQEVQNAKNRKVTADKAADFLSDIKRGFNSLDPNRQVEIVDFFSEKFLGTKAAVELVGAGANSQQIKDITREILTKGLDTTTLHTKFEQVLIKAEEDLSSIHHNIESASRRINEININKQKAAVEVISTNTEIVRLTREKNGFNANQSYDIELRTLEQGRGLREHILEDVPRQIERLEEELTELQKEKRLADKEKKKVDRSNIITRTFQGSRVKNEAISLDDEIKNAAKRLKVKQNTFRDAKDQQNRYEYLKERKERLPGEMQAQQVKQKELQDLIQQLHNEGQILDAELMKNFQEFSMVEESVMQSLNTKIITDAFEQYNKEHMMREKEKMIDAMTVVSEENKTKLRTYIDSRWLHVIPPERWIRRIINRSIAGYNWGNINRDYRMLLDATVGDTTKLDNFIKEGLGSGITVNDQEMQQLRAIVTQDLIQVRFEASGTKQIVPSQAERRVLAAQPWNAELVRAGYLNNPEVAQKVQELLHNVKKEDVEQGRPDAIGKVMEASAKHPLLNLLLMGLTGTSAMAALTKEEKQQQA